MPATTLKERVAALEEKVAALAEDLETERVREGIRKGREQLAQGKVVPMREFLETMRKKYKIARV